MANHMVVRNAAEVHAEIEKLAKEKAVAEVRQIKAMQIGEVVRQGDIYIHRVADKHPRGEAAPTNQLAIGTGMGSRHVAEAPAKVFVGSDEPSWCDSWSFLGPCVVASERFVISHPEHAHVSLPEGVYQITHQTDALTQQRVRD